MIFLLSKGVRVCVCARSMLGKNWNLDFLKLRYYIDSNGGVRLYKLRIILTGDEG